MAIATTKAGFRRGDLIGEGGFGSVYRCTRVVDGREFAQKTLSADADSEAVARFEREVRILSKLDHPNIVRVIGIRLRTPPYWYVMPLYDGSLREEIEGGIASERSFLIFSAVLDAIEYAHAQGVLHRDLKPENILIKGDAIAISDFGLGRMLDATSTRKTRSGQFLGTPFYMAPEQLRDAKRADARSDVYSLGRILYELHAGSLLSGPQDLSLLPPGIAVIVERCTKIDPDKRYQSVTALKQAWASMFDGSLRQTELDELSNLRVELGAPGDYDSDAVDRFIELVAKYVDDDEDAFHEMMMQLHPQALRAMHHKNPDLVRHLVSQFTAFIMGRSWPFLYIDKIADQCRGLYEALPDIPARAELVACLLEAAASHNRFYAMNLFGELMAAPKQPGEEIVLAERLQAMPVNYCGNVRGYVKLLKLPRVLRKLFEEEPEAD